MEYVFPGVYVSEVAFRSHSIEGVATSTPAWTDANTHDPGVTLAGLSSWTAESLAALPQPEHRDALRWHFERWRP